MADKEPTPEEQLLKLIEQAEVGDEKSKHTDAKGASTASAPAQAKLGAPKLPSAEKILSAVSFFRAGKFQVGGDFFARLRQALSVKWANRILLLMIVASVIYLLNDLSFFKPREERYLAPASTADAVTTVAEEALKLVPRELAYYKDPALKRNPFMSPGAEPAVDTKGDTQQSLVPSSPQGKIAEILQGWKLVGISWGDKPLAMVEDSSSGRTYFLRQGQEINGVKVQAISKEKVTLTYEGEEGELF